MLNSAASVVAIMWAILFAAAILGWAAIALHRRSRAFSQQVDTCARCAATTRVTPDPFHSRLVLHCEFCEQLDYQPVRASALSVFGLVRLILVAPALVISYRYGVACGFQIVGISLLVLAGAILSAMVASFLVRFIALLLLPARLPPLWQAEIVAHLAPPPWRQPISADGESLAQASSARGSSAADREI